MFLTEIADYIASGLNSSPPEMWEGGLSIPSQMPVIVDFDPLAEGGTLNLTFGIYVTPSFNEYDLSRSRENSRIRIDTESKGRQGVSKTSYITVSICRPYNEKLNILDALESLPESEWSLLRNVQDNLETFLIHHSIPGVKLETIESDPPNDAALQERVYLAIITLGYKSC